MGTGFFCKIPYNNTIINVLITSYQIINDSVSTKIIKFFFIIYNNFINNKLIIILQYSNLLINDYYELKVINLDPSRKIYTSKNYTTTLI